MEGDILDSLEDVGYAGPLLEEDVLSAAIEEGARSTEFTKLLEFLTTDLAAFTGIEDKVNGTQSPDDEETFLMELSGFLRELGCPYSCLSEGPLSKRLEPRENKLYLLDYLLTELQSARITAANKPHLATQAMETETSAESETAAYLKQMLVVLSFPKPPDNITSFQLFSKVEAKLKELVSKVQPAHLSKPLLKARLSDKQWEIVEYIGTALKQDYETRRDMLLKRLDVTIQSFKWSDRAKNKDDEIAAAYQPIRRRLSPKVQSDLAHVLAAREDLLSIQKTSSGESREKTRCPINRVMIGRVPDRGGRAYEHDVPPPEMPSFQKRQAAPQQQRQQGWSGNYSRKKQQKWGGGGDWQPKHKKGSARGGRRVQGGWGGDNQNQQGGGWGSNQQHQGGQGGNNPGLAFFGGGGNPQQAYQQNISYSGDQYSQQGYQGGGTHGGGGGYQGGRGGYQGGGGGGYQGGGYQGGGGRGGYQGGDGGHQGGGGRGGRGRGRGRGGRGR